MGWTRENTKISNSYATGSVEGTENTGGLVGTDEGTDNSVTNSYWVKETTGLEVSAVGSGKTTDEMMKEDTYSGWNFDKVWKIDEGNDYPKLR